MKRKLLKNECGNISLFILGMMTIMILSLVLVANFGKVLVTKQQSSNSAEAASFAATAAIYDKVEAAITNYDANHQQDIEEQKSDLKDKIDDLKDDINDLKDKLKDADKKKKKETIKKKIKHKKEDRDDSKDELKDLDSGPSTADKIKNAKPSVKTRHPFWSSNKVKIKAIDRVLSDEAPSNDKLSLAIERAVRSSKGEAVKAARQTIKQNNGKVQGSKITFFDNGRVKVKTSVAFETMKYKNVIPEDRKYVKQNGRGPKLGFIQYLHGWGNEKITMR